MSTEVGKAGGVAHSLVKQVPNQYTYSGDVRRDVDAIIKPSLNS